MSDPRLLNIRDLGPRKTWPEDVVRIDRQSKWGNPFAIAGHGRAAAIELYEGWLTGYLLTVDRSFLEPLRGKRLACWCAPLPCHGDVILEWLDAHPVKP